MTKFTSLSPLGPSYIDYGYVYEDSRITLPEFKVIIPSLMPRAKGESLPIKGNLFINAPDCKPAVSSNIQLRDYIIVKSIAAHRTEYYGDVMDGDTGEINGKTTIKWSSGNDVEAGPGPHSHAVAGKTYEGKIKIEIENYRYDHPWYQNLNQVYMKKGSEVLICFVGTSLDEAYVLSLPQCVVGDSKPHTRGGLYVYQQQQR